MPQAHYPGSAFAIGRRVYVRPRQIRVFADTAGPSTR